MATSPAGGGKVAASTPTPGHLAEAGGRTRDFGEIPELRMPVAARSAQHEKRAPSCMAANTQPNSRRLNRERLGNGGQQQQAAKHQCEQHQPHRDFLGIQPVGDPRGEYPQPPRPPGTAWGSEIRPQAKDAPAIRATSWVTAKRRPGRRTVRPWTPRHVALAAAARQRSGSSAHQLQAMFQTQPELAAPCVGRVSWPAATRRSPAPRRIAAWNGNSS